MHNSAQTVTHNFFTVWVNSLCSGNRNFPDSTEKSDYISIHKVPVTIGGSGNLSFGPKGSEEMSFFLRSETGCKLLWS